MRGDAGNFFRFPASPYFLRALVSFSLRLNVFQHHAVHGFQRFSCYIAGRVIAGSSGRAGIPRNRPTLKQDDTTQEQNTMIRQTLRRTFLWSLIAMFLSASLQVQAGMVGNGQLEQQSQTELQRDEVRELLAREDVRAALQQYGVSEQQAQERVDNMTSAELQQMHQQLADLPAGGDGALGIILGIIFVFIILDLLGATDIFPRI
jgi:hypothetical protein